MLLIITNAADIHPNPVAKILNERGVPFFRLNTDRLLTDYDITWQFDKNKSFFSIRYKEYPIEINSNQISCVWERRPMEPLATYDEITDGSIKRTVLEEADGFLRYFRYALIGLNVLWIGHPINERIAGSKILQKIIAQKIGFIIPNTLFSNNIEELSFFKDNDIALKPISSCDVPLDEKNSIVFYTQRVKTKQLQQLGKESFRNTINFLEQYIEKEYELRVTVICGHFFTVKINSQVQKKNQGAIDWRQGYDYGIIFEKIETPNEIRNKCIEFLNYFHLEFGCFDFIKNRKGEYIFLECNTNGQWLWLEEETKLPISNTLAEIFIKRNDEHKKSSGRTS